jgi:hypothetical protein
MTVAFGFGAVSISMVSSMTPIAYKNLAPAIDCVCIFMQTSRNFMQSPNEAAA